METHAAHGGWDAACEEAVRDRPCGAGPPPPGTGRVPGGGGGSGTVVSP